MDQPIPPFVAEIDFKSIELFEVVGKGTFGTVKKGKWGSKDVAVKLIETEQEKTAFLVEVRQLSRVDHPNIVKLYGACTRSPNVCLVMEYAEGGSLYNVLHRMPNTHYTAAHAFSWALQCASGVAYLHNMKPKALIHRDLKPPNMLLILNGTVLKICDFGTACDLQTVMTNNKGSAAWMAPEVFAGSNYSEKCDIFSWGIILWEVLTRKKPFDNIGGPAFRIMWAVHSGERPPLITGCPRILEELMTSCWAKSPADRPSMSYVEQTLMFISRFFKGANKPITVLTPETEQPDDEEQNFKENVCEMGDGSGETHTSTCTYISTNIIPQASPHGGTTLVNQLKSPPGGHQKQSEEQKSSKTKDPGKRLSADLSSFHEKPTHGHRRSGSWGAPLQQPVQSPSRLVGPVLEAGSRESIVPMHMCSSPRPSPCTPLRIEPGPISSPSPNPTTGEETPIFFNMNAYLLLEPKFQPLPPSLNCPKSLALYQNHCQMAQEFLRVQTEMEVIRKRKEELSKISQKEQLSKSVENVHEYLDLQTEKEALVKLRKNLKRQLEVMKAQHKPTEKDRNSDEWVMVNI